MENSCILSLAFILLLSLKITKLSSSTTDEVALLAFKNAITLDPHGLLGKNWSTNTRVCNWIGVTCGLKHHRVAALNVSGFDLEGTIAPHIGNLTFLRSLDVSFNNFHGSIPPEIGSLSKLKYLSLESNYLKGELPVELGVMPFLEWFSVSNNSLSGSIPASMFNVTTLKVLQLSFNHFDGPLPSNTWNTLFNLEELRLSYNSFSGLIPSSIVNASKLTVLIMGLNYFSGSIPDFGDLRLLQILSIRGNNLTAADSTTQNLGFISFFTSCPYLQYLDVSENPLNGVIPAASFGNLSSSLLQFRADGCNIHGVIPPGIGNLSNLIALYLFDNQMIGSIPSSIGKLKKLQLMSLGNNHLHGYIPHDLCQMTYLGELDLSANTFTDSIPECFGEVKSLRKINLGSNKLTSTIPSRFWDLRDLLILNLSSNYLSGNLPSQIGNLKEIFEMDLSTNHFSGDIPSSLSGCLSLQTLSLSHNMFSGSIPQSLGSVIGLVILDFSNNNLSGFIPDSLEQLFFLGYFDVSYNRLDGEIPNEGPFVNFSAQSFVHNSALCGSARFLVPPCMKNHARTRSRSRPRLKDIVRLMVYIVASLVAVIIWVIGIFLSIIFVIIIKSQRDARTPPCFIDHQASLGVSWRIISYRELVQVTSEFNETNLLGVGGFSSVYKGTLPDGLDIAVKVFHLEREGAIESFDTETEILNSIRHRNLVRMIGCCINTEFKALVLAYMPNGSLEKWLYSDTYGLDIVQRLNIAIDVALALEYLHHHHTFPVVHCDIKPSNVLLDQDMTAHVADFGISKLFENGEAVVQTKTLATIGYAAPEYGSEGKVSTKGDVYSYGIMLLEIFTRKKPTDDMFDGDIGLKEWVSEAVERNAISEVLDPALFLQEECMLSIFDLAMKCLAVSPRSRINMIEAAAALQKIKDNFWSYNKQLTQNSSPYYSIAGSSPTS